MQDTQEAEKRWPEIKAALEMLLGAALFLQQRAIVSENAYCTSCLQFTDNEPYRQLKQFLPCDIVCNIV